MPDDIKSRREHILDAVADLSGELLWEGRRGDEDLPRGAIEQAIQEGEITVQEIIDRFAGDLRGYLARPTRLAAERSARAAAEKEKEPV